MQLESSSTLSRLAKTAIVLAVAIAAAVPVALAAEFPGSPVRKLKRADNRRAASALIRATDLTPVMERDPNGLGLPGIPHCADYPADRSDVTVTGEARNSFKATGGRIGSSAIVFKTYADATRYWNKVVRPRFASCDLEVQPQLFRAELQKEAIEAYEVPIVPTGADAARAFRTVLRVSGENIDFDWVQTVVFLRKSRTIGIVKVGYPGVACPCYEGLSQTMARRLIKASR